MKLAEEPPLTISTPPTSSNSEKRAYGEALWCVRKHLSLAEVHLSETLQKLYRECDENKCVLSPATNKEADYSVRNILAAEEHLAGEIIPKLTEQNFDPEFIKNLRKLNDDLRNLRQKMINSGIVFDITVNPLKQILVESFIQEIEKYIDILDQYADQYRQEQVGSANLCMRCSEDLTVK